MSTNLYSPPNAAVSDALPTQGPVKIQVQRMSLHQNAKVSAVLVAVLMVLVFAPLMLIASAFGGARGAGMSVGMLLIALPVYVVFNYIFVIIACLIYNQVAKFVGGFEYESHPERV
jgi:hypothetical protein